ncbi:uncharacterized protein EV422DRAFT_605046 [Fimicolochytrium jonesii]|uniref:uncharacterized protein n=1 Tax=Fimicolochytrium jonesii TaxID=1396493 RepID=UPI0022FF2085|nr:uncharacterized protein EV422DRAFT_605046 [Fimicolochytrium jonesii]KAI8824775.1 hypothetical protein EV422DRAFT_605046 [Fimicolochytrium jonesii]
MPSKEPIPPHQTGVECPSSSAEVPQETRGSPSFPDADIEIQIGSTVFAVHKIYLSHNSKYFQSMLNGPWKSVQVAESGLPRLTLEEPVTLECFAWFLNAIYYPYKHGIGCTEDLRWLFKLFELCDYLLAEDLSKEVVRRIKARRMAVHITFENVRVLLKKADDIRYKDADLREKCREFLLMNLRGSSGADSRNPSLPINPSKVLQDNMAEAAYLAEQHGFQDLLTTEMLGSLQRPLGQFLREFALQALQVNPYYQRLSTDSQMLLVAKWGPKSRDRRFTCDTVE